jgi:uncharacterized protein YqgC (DUF456 family)
MEGMTPLLWLVAVALVLVGIAGAVLPALPGVPLVFAGLFVAAWIDHFQKVGWLVLSVLGVLTVLSFVMDFVATGLGAKKSGASKLAVVGAAVGTVVGLFFSLPGLILGPFLGAVAGELLARKGRNQAVRAGLGTWLGLLLATAGKLALIFAMVGIFITFYVF